MDDKSLYELSRRIWAGLLKGEENRCYSRHVHRKAGIEHGEVEEEGMVVGIEHGS